MIDNTGKDYNKRNQDIAISFSDGRFLNIDNVLAVEGSTDKKFYQEFTNLEILISPKILNESKNKIDCKDKILKAISEQKEKGMHWFGIMDADYSLPIMPSDIEIGKDCIFTDANSLETMLVKYAGVDNFEKIIKKINWQLVKKYCLDKNLVLLALEFSYRIGCLRKKNDIDSLNLSFASVLVSSNNYLDFLTYTTPQKKVKDGKEKLEYSVKFDFNNYVDSLIDKTVFEIEDEASLKELGTEIFSLETSPWIECCQGHDIIHFIIALNKLHQKITSDNRELTASTHDALDYIIINNYKKEYFEQSKIALWLHDKEKESVK